VFGHTGPRSTRSIPSKRRGWDTAGPNIDTIRELLPHADHQAESREVERLEIEDVADLIPLPGALQLLSTLPMERWAIVTSCTRPLAEARIRAASLPMPKHLVTSSDVARGKPAPDPYVKGIELLNLGSQDCIVIEDAPFRDSIRQGRRSPRPRSADHDGIRTARKCRRGLDRPRLRSHRRGTEVQVTIPAKTHSERWMSMFDLCSEGYFQTLQLSLLRGRLLSESDVDSARRVAVINQTFARNYLGDGDPIGQNIKFNLFDQEPEIKDALFEIIGVVSDVKNNGFQRSPLPAAYLPYTIISSRGGSILVRTVVDPDSLGSTIRQEVGP
jgi:HAD superfamily hydrolase (TIGR01509 family)